MRSDELCGGLTMFSLSSMLPEEGWWTSVGARPFHRPWNTCASSSSLDDSDTKYLSRSDPWKSVRVFFPREDVVFTWSIKTTCRKVLRLHEESSINLWWGISNARFDLGGSSAPRRIWRRCCHKGRQSEELEAWCRYKFYEDNDIEMMMQR